MQTWPLKQYLVRIWQGFPLPNSKEELVVIENFDIANFSEIAIGHIMDVIHGVFDHSSSVTQAEEEILELAELERLRISRQKRSVKV